MMNIKIRNIGLFLLLGLDSMSAANAHDHDFFGLSLNLGGPAYYARPEVYYDASPVYVERPRVIYYEHPVVTYGYYEAQPYYYGGDYDEHEHKHGHAYGHYKHHHHDDDDDD